MSSAGPPTYEALQRHLAAQPYDAVTLTFAEIEALVGAPLPPTAARSPAWWSNTATPSVQARGWLDAGWWVAGVSFAVRQVTFVRQDVRP